jgi:outer membrane protein OmpA-like peptidoglycan-associated protein
MRQAADEARRQVRREPATPGLPAGSSLLRSALVSGSPDAMLALQRAAGNRRSRSTVRTLARTPESQFAFAHEGQVESTQVFVGGVPQENEGDVDEFVLWNFLVNGEIVRRGHKAKIDAVARRWAAELQADPNLRIRVLGYASVTGGTALNEDLARRRAESVRDHLVTLGVPEDQIVIDSSGSRLPMDEGTSPQSLARNRRVEISKFFATTVRSSLSDLEPGLAVKLGELKFATNANIADRVTDTDVVFSLGKQTLTVPVTVTSADPDVEVGIIQIATSDVRLGGYSDADAAGEVADFHLPPSAFIDYDHCLNAFGPARDVQFARLPFSRADAAHPSRTPTTLTFETAPEIVLPREINIPGRERGILTQVAWKMTFKIVIVARKGELVVPLDDTAEWDFATFISMIVGPAPKELSRKLTSTTSVNSRTGFMATAPLPDIERAMSMPSLTLRTRMMNQLCKPTVHQGGLDGEFDEEMRRAQEILDEAMKKVVPILEPAQTQ